MRTPSYWLTAAQMRNKDIQSPKMRFRCASFVKLTILVFRATAINVILSNTFCEIIANLLQKDNETSSFIEIGPWSKCNISDRLLLIAVVA